MKYKVLFIDEEKEQQDNFLDYMDNVEDRVDVVCKCPCASLEEMLQLIEDEKPDAVVTDYRLNEIKTDITYNVPYTGSDLVNHYREMRPDFPCFVITSYDGDAILFSNDVNLVYVKVLLNGGEKAAKAKFYDKIIEQITKYKSAIRSAQDGIAILVEKKRAGNISLSEENKLIELDAFLEKSLDSYGSIPQEMKKPENLNKLSLLIEKVDTLLRELD